VTFDNDYFAARATPSLTTVDQDEGGVGRTMAELLIRLIEGEEVPRVTMMPTRLINRRSQ
jgi:DNA-binding LacI/PurR family transcriptional regulator